MRRLFCLVLFTAAAHVESDTWAAQAPSAGRPEVEWEPLPVSKATSTAGARIELLEDDSVRVGGTNPEKDVHVVEMLTERRGLTAIRIEALPDSTLHRGGPGRATNGNFILSEVSLEAVSVKDPDLARPVLFDRASESHRQGDWSAERAVDNNQRTGWAILPRTGESSTAIFHAAESFGFSEGTRLVLRMEYSLGGQTALGRFRVSATTAPDPLAGLVPDEAEEQSTSNRIAAEATSRGVAFLLSRQQLDGSWRYSQSTFPAGGTGLALYTLLECGLPRDHPAVLRAAAFLRGREPTQTYSLSCKILALCELDAKEDHRRIRDGVEQLLDWQQEGFGYPGDRVDLSNTQIAALALRAAVRAKIPGLRVKDRVWADIASCALEHQEAGEGEPRGFSYMPGDHATGSMTTAGVCILAICVEQSSKKSVEVERGLEDGVEWLTRYYSATTSPAPTAQVQNDRWLFYYLYGQERVGSLLGLSRFGFHDWYQKGVRSLFERQRGDGGWPSRSPLKYEDEPNTCFSLLFLERATAPTTGPARARPTTTFGSDDRGADVSLRASGDPRTTIWISSFGDQALEDLASGGVGGELPRVIRVEYLCTTESGEDSSLGAIEPDPAGPLPDDRFALQHTFERPGEYRVRARVTALRPDSDGRGPESIVVLESPPLAIRVLQASNEELLEYASDGSRNLLSAVGATATATSALDGDHDADRAIDNLQGLAWLSSDGDPYPILRIELEKKVRANTILLSHPSPEAGRTGRVERVALRINGKKKVYEIEMVGDDWRKTVFPLSKRMSISEVELKVLEVSSTSGSKSAVGFGEIELQLRK